MTRVGDATDILDGLCEELSPSTSDREAAVQRLILTFVRLAEEHGFTIKADKNQFGVYVEAGLTGEYVWIISGPRQGQGIYFWRESNKSQSAPVAFRYSRTERELLGDPRVEPNGSHRYEPAIDKLAREFARYVRELAKQKNGG